MTIRFATPDEVTTWNDHIVTNPDGGEFFQMNEFAEVKKSGHWHPVHLLLDKTYVLALEKHVPVLGRLWYIQKGPADLHDAALAELRTFARAHGVFTIKIEPPLKKTTSHQTMLKRAGLLPANPVQPTFSTIWLDISPDEDTILASFSSKTRYNIRQAQKAGVVCREVEASDANCQAFYNLFTETADGRFGIRPYAYYKKFWQTFCENGHGKLLFAFADDQLVSADFVMILGKKACRKDAASPRQKNVRGAAALLELETIRLLKELHVTDYDLCGSPSSDRIKDQSDPLYGVGQFKSGFSQEVTDYIGTYQLMIVPWKAQVWTIAIERFVRRHYYRKHHQAYY